MSDQDVFRAIEELERYLQVDSSMLDALQLDTLHHRFQEAVATAERGDSWSEVVARAQAVQEALKSRLAGVIGQRDAIRRELEGQVAGQRALNAYKPSGLA